MIFAAITGERIRELRDDDRYRLGMQQLRDACINGEMLKLLNDPSPENLSTILAVLIHRNGYCIDIETGEEM